MAGFAGSWCQKTQLRFSPDWCKNPTMLAKVCSAAVNGIEAYPVEVEVNAGYGGTIIVIIVSISPIGFPQPSSVR